MRRSLEAAAEEEGGVCEIKTRRAYSTYCHDEASPPRRIAAAAWRLLGREPSFRPTGGGSDASVFNARGIPSVVLSCGYHGAHTFDERVSLADMVAGAEWAMAIAVAATQPRFAGPR